MNKKGQVFLSILLAIFYFISAITLLNLVKDDITIERDDLDCTNASVISDGTKALCLVSDLRVIYLFIVIFSVAGGLITERLAK